MKKYLLLALAINVLSCCAEQSPNDAQINGLGIQFYLGSLACETAHKDELDAIEKFVIENNKNLTHAQLYTALNFQMNGKTALENAKEKDCGTCSLYAERLEMAAEKLNFIIKELDGANLTPEELYKKLKKELSQKYEMAADSMITIPSAPLIR
jgi:hypothetical protein